MLSPENFQDTCKRDEEGPANPVLETASHDPAELLFSKLLVVFVGLLMELWMSLFSHL